MDQRLQTSDSELQVDMRRLNSGSEERSRLTAALSCLRSATAAGQPALRRRPDLLPGASASRLFYAPEGDVGPDSCGSEPQQDADVFSPIIPVSRLQPAAAPAHGRSVSISVLPCSDNRIPDDPAEGAEPEPSGWRTWRGQPAKWSHTPPPPARKLLQLFPNITLTRSKSQESQLANRIEEPGTPRWVPESPAVLSHGNNCVITVLCSGGVLQLLEEEQRFGRRSGERQRERSRGPAAAIAAAVGVEPRARPRHPLHAGQ